MRIEVLLENSRVGWLLHDPQTNRFGFSYAQEWLDSESRFALSPQLPLHPEVTTSIETHSAIVRQFFENLLPEGQALDAAAATNQVSKANLMGLLVALGREMAGALQIRTEIEERGPVRASRRLLPHTELSERIRSRPHIPFSVWDDKVRLSIAGYQDKVAVYQDGQNWYIVDSTELASTHILKPEPVSEKLKGLTANEFFCMRLAEKVGISVARVTLAHVPEPVLSIERFDRSVTRTSEVLRRHVIDGCQALGVSSGFKYERPYGDGQDVRHIRDGASLPRLFQLLQTSANPAEQCLRLLRWVIFQVLIGNTDAHAKNLTFFCGIEGLSLAPAYDLVCCVAFAESNVEDTYAMAIGDAFGPTELSAFEWANFARACRLNSRQVSKELGKLAASVLKWVGPVETEARDCSGDIPILARIRELVIVECERQIQLAPEITRIPADSL